MPPLVTIFQSTVNADGISSKRVITFLAFIFCSIAFFANLFFGYTVEENMFEGMMYIAIAGLGVTAAERFANKTTETNTKKKDEL